MRDQVPQQQGTGTVQHCREKARRREQWWVRKVTPSVNLSQREKSQGIRLGRLCLYKTTHEPSCSDVFFFESSERVSAIQRIWMVSSFQEYKEIDKLCSFPTGYKKDLAQAISDSPNRTAAPCPTLNAYNCWALRETSSGSLLWNHFIQMWILLAEA